jgi:hypothetical protein
MPLYRIKTGKGIEKVKQIQFDKEKELQNLVEMNIEMFFGMKFLETEYSIPNGRIDSLCIDESGTPVIIEYKKKKDLSAIIQGLFYVDWLRTNKRTFEMIVREKMGNELTVDWKVSPRLLIIAEEFDQKETSAINQINASVELIKYSYFGELISFEQLNIAKPIPSYTSCNKETKDIKISEEQISLESVMDKGSDSIKKIILQLRDWIFNISDEIDERVKSSMISYYSNGKGLVWIAPSNKRFKLHLRKGEYNNDYKLIKFDGWGGYPELNISEDQFNNEIEEYVKGLIMKAYEN